MTNKHTFSILPILRIHRQNKQGEVPVYVRITIDGGRTEISTKVYVIAEKWDPGKGRVKGHNDYCRFVNSALKLLNIG